MVFTNDSVTLAMLSFFSTTVDDFCVILIFFAREYVKNYRFSSPETLLAFVKISIGQILGFTIIVVVSLVLGMALHSTVDEDYIDLVGFLPILIGVYKIYELLDDAGALGMLYNTLCCVPPNHGVEIEGGKLDDGEKTPLIKEKNLEAGLPAQLVVEKEEGEIDVILNEKALETLDEVDQTSTCYVCAKKMCCFSDPLIFEVTIYALMFGTDNIAIYVSLFSGVTLLESVAVCVFFYSLLLAYLFIAMIVVVQVRSSLFSYTFCLCNLPNRPAP